MDSTIPPPSSAKSQQRRFLENGSHPAEVSSLLIRPQASLLPQDEAEPPPAPAQEEEEEEGADVVDPVVPLLFRHDSEFSVGSNYAYISPNNLNVWQGAALLTADCLGTGILALPSDIHVLGYGGWAGLGFLMANLPINLFAGTILSHTATHVEERQDVANRLYRESSHVSDATLLLLGGEGGCCGDNLNYEAINTNANANTNTNTSPTFKEESSKYTSNTQQTRQHAQLHHDTATFDFIGLTQALFHDKVTTRLVMVRTSRLTRCVVGSYARIVCATGVCSPQSTILTSAAAAAAAAAAVLIHSSLFIV
jgi:hypothetical protein